MTIIGEVGLTDEVFMCDEGADTIGSDSDKKEILD